MTAPTDLIRRGDAIKAVTDADRDCRGAHGARENIAAISAAVQEPVAWTGSGSMAALADGREGFIYRAKADAHPIPLYAHPMQEPPSPGVTAGATGADWWDDPPVWREVGAELSGIPGELIDKMAEAIRGDTTCDDTPWAVLSEDRKIGWRGDAERALAAVKEYLTAHRPAPVVPAEGDMGNPITMVYRNYRGEVGERTVIPRRIWWGSTDWHPEPGWLMSAYDPDKAADRDFALADCDFRRVAPPVGARVKPLDAIFDAAQVEAAKAMRKFPQPNYVISKVAEEAGEVVKAAIHCAENRETKEAVLGEVVQCMAMLIRLCLEGDQVHGLAALLPAGEGE